MQEKAYIEVLSESAEAFDNGACAVAQHLEQLAEHLESLRARLVDVAASREDEQAKRAMVELWDEQAEAWRMAADVIRRGPLEKETFADELYTALSLRIPEITLAATTPAAVATYANVATVGDMLRERANNIAAAYRARIAREPK